MRSREVDMSLGNLIGEQGGGEVLVDGLSVASRGYMRWGGVRCLAKGQNAGGGPDQPEGVWRSHEATQRRRLVGQRDR